MTFPLRTLRARSALNTPPQGDTARRRSRLLLAVSAVSATLLMLAPTPRPLRTPRARRLVLAGMVVLAAALAPATASAHFEGGRWLWDPTSSVVRIPYDSDCSLYAPVIDAAASTWMQATAQLFGSKPVFFDKFAVDPKTCQSAVPPFLTTPVHRVPGVDVYDAIYRGAWWWGLTVTDSQDCIFFGAICWLDICTTGCRGDYSYAQILLNAGNPRFVRASRFDQQGVVAHELGHVLGLAHAGAYNKEPICCYSIMDYAVEPYNTPQPHDQNDYSRLYPSLSPGLPEPPVPLK